MVRPQVARAIQRRDGARHQVGRDHRKRGADRQRQEQVLADPRDEHQREEHDHRRHRRHQHGHGDLLGAVAGGVERLLAHVKVPDRVLDVDDAVVDHAPRISASPPSVMMFRVWPVKYSPRNAARIDSGIDRATITVLRRLPRNSSTTSEARTAPRTAFEVEVAEGVADVLRLIEGDLDVDVLRDAAAAMQLGQERLDVVDDADGAGPARRSSGM